MRSSVAACFVFLLLHSVSAAGVEATRTEYRKALPGYVFQFPRDYFDHPDFRTEWWYYTGNLRTADGRRFGYELTFFRHGVSRVQRSDATVWDVQDVWLAHFAVSDMAAGRFHHSERLNRSGAGQAGVDASNGRVWNGNWQVTWQLDSSFPAGFREQRLRAIGSDFTVDLQFKSNKPAVVQGKNGVSQKAAGPGRASHYVSLTRLLTAGVVQIEGRSFKVEGQSWMDHEFFTHSLEPNQSGWDWFSLQLQDGSELMLYRLRRKDGSIEPYSSGTFIDNNGRSTHLASGDYELRPEPRMWTSPETGGKYPIEWTLRVPSLGIEARTTTPLRSQEIVGKTSATPNYWEGAIDVQGTRNGRRLIGSGYLETTGYAGAVRMGDR